MRSPGCGRRERPRRHAAGSRPRRRRARRRRQREREGEGETYQQSGGAVGRRRSVVSPELKADHNQGLRESGKLPILHTSAGTTNTVLRPIARPLVPHAPWMMARRPRPARSRSMTRGNPASRARKINARVASYHIQFSSRSTALRTCVRPGPNRALARGSAGSGASCNRAGPPLSVGVQICEYTP